MSKMKQNMKLSDVNVAIFNGYYSATVTPENWTFLYSDTTSTISLNYE